MSIFSYTSTQGMTKKTPGPRAPPVSSRPSLKMTALSYSCKVIIMTGDRNPIYLIEDIEEAELRCLGGKIYYKICDKRNLSFMKWCKSKTCFTHSLDRILRILGSGVSSGSFKKEDPLDLCLIICDLVNVEGPCGYSFLKKCQN